MSARDTQTVQWKRIINQLTLPKPNGKYKVEDILSSQIRVVLNFAVNERVGRMSALT